MQYQYYFFVRSTEKLITYLQTNDIAYKVREYSNIQETFVQFTLVSNHKKVNFLLNELANMNCKPTIYIKYTEMERKSAQFLWVWPKRQSIEIVNDMEAYDYHCAGATVFGETAYKHEVQKGLLSIAREPSPKSQNSFWTESTGFSVLFASNKVVDMLRSANFEGINIIPVLKRSGQTCETIYQIRAKNLITQECIQLGHGEIRERCPICGKEQFGFNDSFVLHLYLEKVPYQCDFYETERIFGLGIAHPLFIISQRFYCFLKENKLTGGLDIAPIFPADSQPLP